MKHVEIYLDHFTLELGKPILRVNRSLKHAAFEKEEKKKKNLYLAN